jgi:hypothetical protein
MRYQNSKFWNRNSNFLTLQTSEFKKYFPTGIFGIKTKLEFCLQWGSQKSEPKIGIPNLAVHSMDHRADQNGICHFCTCMPCRKSTLPLPLPYLMPHSLAHPASLATACLCMLTDCSCSLYSGTNCLLCHCSFSLSLISSSLHAAACLSVLTDCSCSLYSGTDRCLCRCSFSPSLTPRLLHCCSFSLSLTSSSLCAAACHSVLTDCSCSLYSETNCLLCCCLFFASLTPGLLREFLRVSALRAKCNTLELAHTITSHFP